MKGLSLAAQVTMFPKSGIGTIEQTVTCDRPGRVKFLATYWPAKLYQSDCTPAVLPGEQVRVVGRQGITLLVAVESTAHWGPA